MLATARCLLAVSAALASLTLPTAEAAGAATSERLASNVRLTDSIRSTFPVTGAMGSLAIRRYPARKLSNGLATFRLSGLAHRAIVSARLEGPRPGRAVSAGSVRRALRVGTLVLRVPPSWRSRSAVALAVRSRRNRPVVGTRNPAPPATAPALSATTAPCGPAVGAFGGSARPPACWRPYASTSPFNSALPANPTIDGRSANVVRRLLGFGAIEDLTAGKASSASNDYGRPAYFSTASDPQYRVHCTESWGKCSVEGATVRIPSAATAASGSDGHMSVVDQASGIEYDFWRVQSKPLGGGTLAVAWGGRTRIDGDGRGSDAVAAQFGSMAGVLRLEEAKAGVIDHALFIYVHCDSGRFVYPATKTGEACAQIGESNADAPAMGTRFQLNMSNAEIDALRVPTWKKAILRAMARYGLIVGDTGSIWGIKEESARVYTSFGLSDHWVDWARTLTGVTTWESKYYFDLAAGVNWQQRLRVIAPCVSQRTC